MSFLRAILILGRVSNLPTVWTNVAVGYFVAGGTWDLTLLWLILGASLLYVSGMTLNDAFDAEWDRRHAPERPIPANVLPRSLVWYLGGLYLVFGCLTLGQVAGADWRWIGSLAACIVAYNILHKHWSPSVWIMAGCRFLLYPLAASAVDGLSEPAWFWAVAMALHVAGITLVARGERTGGAVKRIAWALLALPVVVLAVLIFVPEFTAFAIALPLLGGYWLWSARGMLKKGVGAFVGHLLAGLCFLDALAALSLGLGTYVALFCLGCFVLAGTLQRFVPAT